VIGGFVEMDAVVAVMLGPHRHHVFLVESVDHEQHDRILVQPSAAGEGLVIRSLRVIARLVEEPEGLILTSLNPSDNRHCANDVMGQQLPPALRKSCSQNSDLKTWYSYHTLQQARSH
jgi:hypothetical protein